MTNNLPPKKETVSFRLPSHELSILRHEAQQKQISLNTLVLQIFDRYVSWWRHEQGFRFIPASVDLLRLLFESAGEEKARDFGKWIGSKLFRDAILYMFGKETQETILEFLKIYCARFQYFDYTDDNGNNIFSIIHGVNEPFSLFLAQAFKSILETIDAKLEEHHTANSVTLAFRLKSSVKK